ncbi:MAG TPA: GvpL/GvpF family gas vesicle protein [Myxococcales bacterium]|nr:GvpL/GvpF family gas vesicle protein [Myxococcales bacterium]
MPPDIQDQVLYLYGVVQGGQPLPPSPLAALRAVPFSSLAAVVEEVPAGEFSSEALEQKLSSIDFVAPLARRHAAVLDDLMRHGPVVPAHLCTRFSSAGALASRLEEDAPRLHGALQRLAGRQEWGLKVLCDHQALRSAAASSDPQARDLEAAAAAATPGQAFVLRKRRDGRVAEVAAGRIDQVVEEVLGALAPAAASARELPSITSAVLNAALLVDVDRRDWLHGAVQHLAARLGPEGFGLELTGPWPAYSFCGEEEAA